MIDFNKILEYDDFIKYRNTKHSIIPLSLHGIDEYVSPDNLTTYKYLNKFHPKAMKFLYDEIEYGKEEAERIFFEEKLKQCTKKTDDINLPDNNQDKIEECIINVKPNGNQLHRQRNRSMEDIKNVNKFATCELKKSDSITKFIKKKPIGIIWNKIPRIDNLIPEKRPDSLHTKNIKRTISTSISKYGDKTLDEVLVKENERFRKIVKDQKNVNQLNKMKLPNIMSYKYNNYSFKI